MVNLLREDDTDILRCSGKRCWQQTVAEVGSRVRFDLDYNQNWSLGLDLKILVLTSFR